MKVTDVANGKKIIGALGLFLVVMVLSLPYQTVQAAKQETTPNVAKTVNKAATKPELNQEDLVIGGLSLNMGKDKMIALLGTAKTTEQFTLDYFAGGKNVKFTKYNYPGLSVTVIDVNGRIIEVDTTDVTYKTARGIKTGDSITKVKELYGEEDLHSPSRVGQPFYMYTKAKSPEVLSFKVDPTTKKIVKISVDSWSD